MKKLILLMSILGIYTSCITQDSLEKSDRNKPTAIYIVNPSNPSTTIQGNIEWGEGTDSSPDYAYVSLPPEASLDSVQIQSITIPSLAKVEPNIKSVTNFNTTQTFWVIAENGTNKRRLDVIITVGTYERQIKYSSLTDFWVPIGQFSDGNSYYNIGETGQSTPWANTNIVAAILNKATCVPSGFPNPTGNVVLSTLYNKTAGISVGSGIASANIFIGAFRSNSANFLPRDKQRNNTDHGIPFIYKPRAIKFEYKYTPGTQVEEWIEGTGAAKWVSRDVNEKDSMEMYAIIQKRVYDQSNPQSTKFYRIGSAGFISSETTSEWTTKEVTFHYGQSSIINSTSTDPQAYRVAGINKEWSPIFVHHYYNDGTENGPPVQASTGNDTWKYTTQRVTELWGTTTDEATHLTLSFSSSANGWKYKGAGTDPNRARLGSRLEIRNVELVY